MPDRHLTNCELEVMDVIWSQGRVTVQDVVDALTRPLAYTTVLTTARILDDKGIIRRCGKIGRAYVYEAIISREDVQRSMTDDLATRLYGGSVKSLVLSLLGGTNMTDTDISELKAAIETLEADS